MIQGLSFVHRSPLGSHGTLKTSNVLISSRWILKINGFGLHGLRSAATYESENEQYSSMTYHTDYYDDDDDDDDVKYTSICIAQFNAKRLKCAQTWITQFYLQITPCLPLLPAAEHHRPLAGTHFTVPRRVEG